MYIVVNCPWNKMNCPKLIGQKLENPPLDVIVRKDFLYEEISEKPVRKPVKKSKKNN